MNIQFRVIQPGRPR